MLTRKAAIADENAPAPPDIEMRVVTAGFHHRVYEVVQRVPPGFVTTYGDVATLLGSPRVARHVGWALAALSDQDVPWHRVINSRGRISFKGDTVRGELQERLLNIEGVTFSATGRIEEFTTRRWTYPEDPR